MFCRSAYSLMLTCFFVSQLLNSFHIVGVNGNSSRVGVVASAKTKYVNTKTIQFYFLFDDEMYSYNVPSDFTIRKLVQNSENQEQVSILEGNGSSIVTAYVITSEQINEINNNLSGVVYKMVHFMRSPIHPSHFVKFEKRLEHRYFFADNVLYRYKIPCDVNLFIDEGDDKMFLTGNSRVETIKVKIDKSSEEVAYKVTIKYLEELEESFVTGSIPFVKYIYYNNYKQHKRNDILTLTKDTNSEERYVSFVNGHPNSAWQYRNAYKMPKPDEISTKYSFEAGATKYEETILAVTEGRDTTYYIYRVSTDAVQIELPPQFVEKIKRTVPTYGNEESYGVKQTDIQRIDLNLRNANIAYGVQKLNGKVSAGAAAPKIIISDDRPAVKSPTNAKLRSAVSAPNPKPLNSFNLITIVGSMLSKTN